MDGVINGSIANFQLNVHNESGYQEISITGPAKLVFEGTILVKT